MLVARRFATLASVVVLSAGLAACGGSSGSAPAAAPPSGPLGTSSPPGGTAAAPDRAGDGTQAFFASFDRAQSSGAARMTMKLTSAAGGQTFTVTARGLIDLARGSAKLTMTTAAAGRSLTLTSVTVGGVTYLKGVPGVAPGKWSTSPEAAGSSGGQDPTQTLELLRATADKITRRGSAEVRGRHTTRYTATMNVGKVGARYDNETLKKAIAELAKSGLKTIPVDYYIDDQGRPARAVEDLHLVVAGQKVTTKVLIDIYDWGTAATISAPPRQDVVSATAAG